MMTEPSQTLSEVLGTVEECRVEEERVQWLGHEGVARTAWTGQSKIVRHHAVAKPEGSGGKGIGHSCVYRGVVAETVHAREEVDGGHGGGAEDEGQVLIVSYVL